MGVVVLHNPAALGAALVVLKHIGVHDVAHLEEGRREEGREGGREGWREGWRGVCVSTYRRKN